MTLETIKLYEPFFGKWYIEEKLGEGSSCRGFCTACFDGKYPTEVPVRIKNKYDSKISESEGEQ